VTTRIAMTLQVPREALPEYTRRHEQIWEELKAAIREQGGRNYSIFAAPHLDVVISYVEVDDPERWNRGATTELTLRWWRHMADIMPTNDDLSPISAELPLVFHLD
jgi:L-rhamnose mutarotase